MNSTTAEATVHKIRSMFARFGLCEELVSDNGPQFISDCFKVFLKENCVKHTLCPPYHAASNGLAERHVQTFKRMFAKEKHCLPLQHKVDAILFHYRNIPHTTTGKTPAELFLKRCPRTLLSLIKPNLQKTVESRQFASKVQRYSSVPGVRKFDFPI